MIAKTGQDKGCARRTRWDCVPDVVVVGAGHNGLVAACYLALAGREVLVLEALDRPGGGSRTEERVPGYHFDLHSVAHNIINMTAIPDELDLAGAGLVYTEMDPFSTAVHRDGRRVRFHRSIEATLDSIAEEDGAEAKAYRTFMDQALPLVGAMMPAIRGESGLGRLGSTLAHVTRVMRHGGLGTAGDILGNYDSLLKRRLVSDLTRGPVAAFAAHAGVGPTSPGGGLFAFWQAAYHRSGQWHAQGGAQSLTDALVRRLVSLGGTLRTSAPVEAIHAPTARVRSVEIRGGERIDTAAVITAIDPTVALLQLLRPALSSRHRSELAGLRRGNVVQALIHVACDRLPAYPGARAGDWNGLQSYVDRLEDLGRAWETAQAGLLPDPLPLYAFTPSAIDSGLAPKGHHTVYLACPAAPARLVGGWPLAKSRFVEAAMATMEQRAPGFAATVSGMTTWTPDQMEEQGWVGAHPMHLDLSLDQLGFFRPTRSMSDHRTPVSGLYISGAGTAPTGGIAGTPGRQAARALLADTDHKSR
ncbi:MAG: phytoene desaturase family protein [Acidimicrobiales bacterium]